MNARGIGSYWIQGVVVALVTALLPGCLPKGFKLDFLIEFDKPLAPLEAAIEVPDLEGTWGSRDDSQQFTIEMLRAPHLPPNLYMVSERDKGEDYSGVVWIVKAGESLYLNFSDGEAAHIATAESFAEWRRTADTKGIIMRLEVEGNSLRTFLMQESAPAVQGMFADGVLEMRDRTVVTNGLREALAAVDGAAVFPPEMLHYDLMRAGPPK